MFARTWRKHWGLTEDPFAYEDADKDPVLDRVDADAVHSSFDRIFGSVAAPGPGIVVGEKGSGKSGLRRAVRRRLDADSNDDNRVFHVEYDQFDHYLDSLRRSLRLPAGGRGIEKTPSEIARKIRLADHLDAVLSLGVTQLVDGVLAAPARARKLEAKQKVNLAVLSALYYDSRDRSAAQAQASLRRAMRLRSLRPFGLRLLRTGFTLLALLAAAVPFVAPLLESGEAGRDWGAPKYWVASGVFVLAVVWIWTWLARHRLRSRVGRAVRAVRVLPRDPAALTSVSEALRPDLREELSLPAEGDDTSRYELLEGFIQLLQALGYSSYYVLVDRVDESTLLGSREEWVRPFVESLLDHRLLQFPGLALKLFLPVELGQMYLGASPEQLKRMRLDKSNTVLELRWTGQELYEIANRRIGAVREQGGPGTDLSEFFMPEVDRGALRETLEELGTPRYAFGFLSELFSEWTRDLPEELEADAPDWKIPRAHFDLIRSSWASRSRVLRRTLN
jgi:hypothetical protein